MKKIITSIILTVFALVGLVHFATGFINYTKNDLDNVKLIIMEQEEATVLDYIKYDTNKDLKITSVDYVHIKNSIENQSEDVTTGYVAIGGVYMLATGVAIVVSKTTKN